MNEPMTDVAEQARRTADEITRPEGKPISTLAHGVLDYTLSPTLAFGPQAFGFPRGGPASLVPRIYGAASMAYSGMTRYELGLLPLVPMKTHLIVDAVSSVFMAVSPWLLRFGKVNKKKTWLPHLMFAVAELAIVALSDPRSKR
jgi:hypothetical protein